MPELPEVETVRRSLEPLLVGQTITGLEIGTFAGVLGVVGYDLADAALRGRRIVAVRRRGKYLLVDLDDGSGIEIHLRMTGHVQVTPRKDDPIRFQHLAILLANGMDLRFADQRKFGRVIVHPGNPELGIKTKLGPEPFSPEFTADYLAGVLRSRVAAIKTLLLDQRIVAGIGNIYADEALFLAGIHPGRAGGSLTEAEVSELHRTILQTLIAGIELRGTSFSSYRDATGQPGENQHTLQVYGRGRLGLPCYRCGAQLQYAVYGGRTSHYCPFCQPLASRSGESRSRE
ncbi:MAG: DNA-formamidopyrimidine glycosylase [Thermomicrobiales bacterium]|nr:DNA-formamidopyrimidine glycosylase [Thermomicrobiales bacterium]